MFHRSAIVVGMPAAATFVPQVGAQTVLIGGEPGPNRGARAETMPRCAKEVARLTESSLSIDMRRDGDALHGDSAGPNALWEGGDTLGVAVSRASSFRRSWS